MVVISMSYGDPAEQKTGIGRHSYACYVKKELLFA
jgi:hypothetical protein